MGMGMERRRWRNRVVRGIVGLLYVCAESVEAFLSMSPPALGASGTLVGRAFLKMFLTQG